MHSGLHLKSTVRRATETLDNRRNDQELSDRHEPSGDPLVGLLQHQLRNLLDRGRGVVKGT